METGILLIGIACAIVATLLLIVADKLSKLKFKDLI
jgi:hypothetical protein